MNNYNPYIGFMRGNIFESLYEPYKNYKFDEINPSNEKEYQRLLLQTYQFNMHDTNLYLDNHPNDTNMINMYNEYLKYYNQSLQEYQRNYGPTTLTDGALNTSPWAWDNSPWPWEVKNV